MDNNSFLQSLQRRFPVAWQRAPDFWRLTRMDRPIGIYLLLWPTLWCLWIAGEGTPSVKNVVIFVLGTVLMRATSSSQPARCSFGDCRRSRSPA